MPSIDDVFNELKNVNMNLQVVRSELTQVKNTLKTGFSDILQNMQTLIALESFINQTLGHISEQNDITICILEKISQQSCHMLRSTYPN